MEPHLDRNYLQKSLTDLPILLLVGKKLIVPLAHNLAYFTPILAIVCNNYRGICLLTAQDTALFMAKNRRGSLQIYIPSLSKEVAKCRHLI